VGFGGQCCSRRDLQHPGAGNGGTGNTYDMKLRNYGGVAIKVTAVVTVSGLPNPWNHSATSTPTTDTFALGYTLNEDSSFSNLAAGGGGTEIIPAGWDPYPVGNDQNFDLQLKTPTGVGPSHAGRRPSR